MIIDFQWVEFEIKGWGFSNATTQIYGAWSFKVISQSCLQGETTTCGPSTNYSNVNGINVSIHVWITWENQGLGRWRASWELTSSSI